MSRISTTLTKSRRYVFTYNGVIIEVGLKSIVSIGKNVKKGGNRVTILFIELGSVQKILDGSEVQSAGSTSTPIQF